jgi:hypothetical protein
MPSGGKLWHPSLLLVSAEALKKTDRCGLRVRIASVSRASKPLRTDLVLTDRNGVVHCECLHRSDIASVCCRVRSSTVGSRKNESLGEIAGERAAVVLEQAHNEAAKRKLAAKLALIVAAVMFRGLTIELSAPPGLVTAPGCHHIAEGGQARRRGSQVAAPMRC